MMIFTTDIWYVGLPIALSALFVTVANKCGMGGLNITGLNGHVLISVFRRNYLHHEKTEEIIRKDKRINVLAKCKYDCLKINDTSHAWRNRRMEINHEFDDDCKLITKQLKTKISKSLIGRTIFIINRTNNHSIYPQGNCQCENNPWWALLSILHYNITHMMHYDSTLYPIIVLSGTLMHLFDQNILFHLSGLWYHRFCWWARMFAF